MPKTKFGKWAVWCMGSFFIFLIIGNIFVASGQEGGETFTDNLAIAIPMSLALLSGILAFIFGLISIIKSKERSVVVFIITGIGLLITFFALGEFFGPDH